MVPAKILPINPPIITTTTTSPQPPNQQPLPPSRAHIQCNNRNLQSPLDICYSRTKGYCRLEITTQLQPYSILNDTELSNLSLTHTHTRLQHTPWCDPILSQMSRSCQDSHLFTDSLMPCILNKMALNPQDPHQVVLPHHPYPT